MVQSEGGGGFTEEQLEEIKRYIARSQVKKSVNDSAGYITADDLAFGAKLQNEWKRNWAIAETPSEPIVFQSLQQIGNTGRPERLAKWKERRPSFWKLLVARFAQNRKRKETPDA